MNIMEFRNKKLVFDYVGSQKQVFPVISLISNSKTLSGMV